MWWGTHPSGLIQVRHIQTHTFCIRNETKIILHVWCAYFQQNTDNFRKGLKKSFFDLNIWQIIVLHAHIILENIVMNRRCILRNFAKFCWITRIFAKILNIMWIFSIKIFSRLKNVWVCMKSICMYKTNFHKRFKPFWTTKDIWFIENFTQEPHSTCKI